MQRREALWPLLGFSCFVCFRSVPPHWLPKGQGHKPSHCARQLASRMSFGATSRKVWHFCSTVQGRAALKSWAWRAGKHQSAATTELGKNARSILETSCVGISKIFSLPHREWRRFSSINKQNTKKICDIMKSYKLEISAFQAALYSVLEQQNYFISPKVGFLHFIGQHSHVLCSTKYISMH